MPEGSGDTHASDETRRTSSSWPWAPVRRYRGRRAVIPGHEGVVGHVLLAPDESPRSCRRSACDMSRGGRRRGPRHRRGGRGVRGRSRRQPPAYERDLEAMAATASACMLDALEGVEKPALVLDIDETALSNYDWMVSVDFLRDSPLLADLFAQHADTSAIPAIEPVLELYATARQHDIAVFFITGRAERLREVTEANLKNMRYTDFAGATFNSPDYKEPSIVPFKSGARADIEEQGYTIIANVGDQDSD